MENLLLSDQILQSIEKPARYIGHEVNAVIKNKDHVAIRYALCFPDVYEIAMSHLGSQILYHIYNQRTDVWCERVFSPWFDLDRIMREQKIPLFALESQDPIKDFDFLGITLQYEMCYTNVLQVLDLAQIPFRSVDRTDEHPIVIGGGPCVYNPEPIADFFDVFFIGEGEVGYNEFFDLYLACKASYDQEGQNSTDSHTSFRQYFLQQVATLDGYYVPSLYDVGYSDEGHLISFEANHPNAQAKIQKQVVADLETAPYPEAPVVPYIKATQDRIVLEIQRGCIRGCRFCQAGMVYRPTRPRSLATLKRIAKTMLQNTGHDEISLSSLSSSDYKQLEELITFLVDELAEEKVNISLPSLRIDAFSLDIMRKVQDVRKSSLTFAPEAGTQRLRDVINKGLTEEMILGGAGQAFEGGWSKVKLYFMLGLPTETDEDIQAIAELAEAIAKRYYEIPKEQRYGKCQITISSSFFIPKPFTPFQWSPMFTREEYIRRATVLREAVRKQFNQKSLKYQWHEADVTIIEGLLARGDRRISAVIERAYALGAMYDSWSESFQYHTWMQAFEESGIEIGMDYYIFREREVEELLPWDFIDIGVRKDFLVQDWLRAKQGIITPNCREQCTGCGAAIYQGGVCFED